MTEFSRKDARELMMTVLYQMDVNNDYEDPDPDHYFAGHALGRQKTYCYDILDKACRYREEIDHKIEQYSVGWKISRMPKTDISILRLSVCELLYMDDIPEAVTINEAVELAKKYGTDQSPRFVNAILGSITREGKHQ